MGEDPGFGKKMEILEALQWLSARHLKASDDTWKPRPDDQEWVKKEGAKRREMGKLAASVRKRPAVQKEIKELTTSENEWIREAAKMALARLND